MWPPARVSSVPLTRATEVGGQTQWDGREMEVRRLETLLASTDSRAVTACAPRLIVFTCRFRIILAHLNIPATVLSVEIIYVNTSKHSPPYQRSKG